MEGWAEGLRKERVEKGYERNKGLREKGNGGKRREKREL